MATRQRRNRARACSPVLVAQASLLHYRRHIKNFTYTSAILTDLIKKSTTWRWGPQEQQAFDELKDKVANAKCLGVPML